jgi:hypothetical protein
MSTLTDFKYLRCFICKVIVSWVVALRILVEIYHRFRSAYCLHHQSKVARTSETSVNLYETASRNVPQDSHLYCFAILLVSVYKQSLVYVFMSACPSLCIPQANFKETGRFHETYYENCADRS